jgi:hypothetical protein
MGAKAVKQQLLSAEIHPQLAFLLRSKPNIEPLSLAKSLCNKVPSFVTKSEFLTLIGKLGRRHAVAAADLLLHKGEEYAGFISMYEFLSAMLLLADALWSDKLHVLFALYDLERTGELTQENFELLSLNVLNVIEKAAGVRVMSDDQRAQFIKQVFTSRDSLLIDDFVKIVKGSVVFAFLVRVQQSSAPVLHPAMYAFDSSLQVSEPVQTKFEPSQVKFPRLESSFAEYKPKSSKLSLGLQRGRHSSLQRKDIVRIVRPRQNGQVVKQDHIRRLKLVFDLLSLHSIDCIRMSDIQVNKNYKFLKRIALGFKGSLRKAPTFHKFLEEVFPSATIKQIGILASWASPRQEPVRTSERQEHNRSFDDERYTAITVELQL